MLTKPYDVFRGTMHDYAYEQRLLLRVMFELTYNCNFHCRHCYVPVAYRQDYKKKELKTEGVFRVLRQLKEAGCFYLGFTGGEPFMRKDALEIFHYAKRCGFEVIVYTNGSLIDEETASQLARLDLNKIDITLPAINRKTFERLSGVLGSSDKVFKTIDVLHKKGVNLGFKTCLLKGNEAEIKHIKDFSVSLNAFHRLDDLLYPCLDGSIEPYKCRTDALSYEPGLGRIDDFKQCLSRETAEADEKEPFGCGAGRTQAAITPAGELKLCVMIDHPKYDILKTSLKTSWRKLRNFSDSINKKEGYRCSSCHFQYYCHWCPARSWLQNKTSSDCPLKEQAAQCL